MGAVAPQYHAVISADLLACLRDRAGPASCVTAPPRQAATVAPALHRLRRDGGHPVRLTGMFVASGRGAVVAQGDTRYRPMISLYIDSDERLIAHVILDPENDDAARPIYRVVEVLDDGDVERLAVETGLSPTGTPARAQHETSTLSEGNSHVFSNAVA